MVTKKKGHILLYNSRPKDGEDKIDFSLALLSIAALPMQEGYTVHYVENFDPRCDEKIIEYAKDAICVGFGVMTGNQIRDGLRVSKLIKDKYPDVPIVWGGWHPSILPEQTLANKYIDMLVVGQGQRTFFELIETLAQKKDYTKLLGIWYKKDGKAVHTGPRAMEDLNNFPPLPYELLGEHNIAHPVDEVATRVVEYFTSQGCPHRCNFCADPLVYKRRTTLLSADRVVADIKRFINDFDANGVICTDTNFFIKESRVKEICEQLIAEDIKIAWGSVNGRAGHLLRYSEDTWRLLQKIGFSSFLVGAEAGNQETLDYIDKDGTVEEIIELAKRLKKYDFKAYFSFILGFPPNPKWDMPYSEQIKRDWEGLVNITDTILKIKKDNMFYFLIYTPYPGSPMYENCKLGGFTEPQNLEEWADFTLDNVRVPWIPEKYIQLVDQLNTLYIPFLTGNVYPKFKHYGVVGHIAKVAFMPLHALVLLRWKTRFFGLPFEYHFLKFSKKFARNVLIPKNLKTLPQRAARKMFASIPSAAIFK